MIHIVINQFYVRKLHNYSYTCPINTSWLIYKRAKHYMNWFCKTYQWLVPRLIRKEVKLYMKLLEALYRILSSPTAISIYGKAYLKLRLLLFILFYSILNCSIISILLRYLRHDIQTHSDFVAINFLGIVGFILSVGSFFIESNNYFGEKFDVSLIIDTSAFSYLIILLTIFKYPLITIISCASYYYKTQLKYSSLDSFDRVSEEWNKLLHKKQWFSLLCSKLMSSSILDNKSLIQKDIWEEVL